MGSLVVPHAPQPTIYVVDDDDAVRDSLKILLESYQLTVRDFGSVPEFLNGLAAGRTTAASSSTCTCRPWAAST